MVISAEENDTEQFDPLHVGELLPPSKIDAKFARVDRDHKVYHNIPPHPLEDMNATEWKDNSFLRKAFKTPRTGRQRKDQESPYAFPCCILACGAAAESEHKRMIV